VAEHERLAMAGAVALLLLAVTIPAQCRLLRGTYMGGLLMFVFGILAAVLVVIAATAVRDLVRSGDKDVERVKGRKETVERFLNQ